jgi:hypothetical protein
MTAEITLISLHPPRPYATRWVSLTHEHRSIGYRNRNPQPLADSSTRLMYLRVYDSRISSHQPAPSPSLYDLLTHAHSTLPTPTLITITWTQVLWCLERLTRTTLSCCETTRTRLNPFLYTLVSSHFTLIINNNKASLKKSGIWIRLTQCVSVGLP